jgi:hypothetical protein
MSAQPSSDLRLDILSRRRSGTPRRYFIVLSIIGLLLSIWLIACNIDLASPRITLAYANGRNV